MPSKFGFQALIMSKIQLQERILEHEDGINLG
jgi:hypothetical protein